jgi:hypothetical protein
MQSSKVTIVPEIGATELKGLTVGWPLPVVYVLSLNGAFKFCINRTSGAVEQDILAVWGRSRLFWGLARDQFEGEGAVCVGDSQVCEMIQLFQVHRNV